MTMSITAIKRLLFPLFVVVCFAVPAFADVTISGNVNFSSLDGSALDDDHASNGTFTVNSNLTILGTVNCNDSGPSANSACNMKFAVSGNFTMNSGSALYAENRTGAGNGGDITVNVGGNVTLQGSSGFQLGALISSSATSSGGGHAGHITITAGGTTTQGSASIVYASSASGLAGQIDITGNSTMTMGGVVIAGTGATLGSGNNAGGGAVKIKSNSHVEPGLNVDGTAIIATEGGSAGSGITTLEACGMVVKGLVASIARGGGGTARVVLRSGTTIIIDGRDLGHFNAPGGRYGNVRADASQLSATGFRADVYAKDAITIFGGDGTQPIYAVTSNAGGSSNSASGTVNVISTNGTVNANGFAFSALGATSGSKGGTVNVSAKNNVTLDSANIKASGDFSTSNSQRAGGHINVRSYSGGVSWQVGTGDVRPVGSASGVPAAQQGTIAITYCTTVSTSGSTFPTNGSAVGVFPTIAQSCSPAAPSLPSGESLPDCNDPPIANNDAYTVAEGGTLNVPAPGVLTNDVDPEGQPITAILVQGPLHATSFTLNANGSFSYTHDGSETTTDTFKYKANDGSLDSNVATVTINITPVNDPPVANPDTYTVNEGGTLNPPPPGVLGNDTDPDSPVLTAVLVSGPTNASAFTLNPNGSFSYTHNGSETTVDSFTYKASDGALFSNTVTVTINITPVNDAPVVTVPAAGSTNEDTALNFGGSISASDTDAGAGNVTLSVSSTHGTVTLGSTAGLAVSGNGTSSLTATGTISAVNGGLNGLTYSPAANYNGSAAVTVTVNDNGNTGTGGAQSDTKTINVTVNPVNDAPVAVADSYSTNEDTPLNVPPPGVLGNDSDVDSPTLTAVLVSGPTNASSFTLNPDGSFSYTPNANFNGSDSFTYKANDGTLDSNTVTVSITVNSVNDAPVVNAPPTASTNEDTALTFNGNISVSDVDAGSGNVTVTLASTNGTLTLGSTAGLTVSGNGTSNVTATGTLSAVNAGLNGLTYSPNANYNGPASLSVTANDNGNTGAGGPLSDTKNVAITVNSVNDAPVAVPDSYSTSEDTSLTVAAPGVLGNDSDVDSPTITAVLVSNASNGNVTLNPDGSFTYIPNPNFNGTDSFTYKANDGTADSNTVTVTITVTAVNDAPVAVADAYSTNEDTPLNVPPPGVLGNDTDVDSPTITAILVSGPSNASSFTLNANGSFSYVPNANFNGSDSFTYKANDGSLDSNTVTVSITVNAVNDAPVAVADSYSTNEDTTLNVPAPGVLGNDSDVDSPTITAVLVSGPSNAAAFALNPDGSFSYTPNANFSGTDSFTYKANDGAADSNTVTVTITVVAINDAPVVNAPPAASTNEDTTLTFNGNISVSDVDAGSGNVTVTIAATNGNVTLASTSGLTVSGNGTGNITATGTLADLNNALNGMTFSPDANYNGSASLTVTANDNGNTGLGGPLSDTKTVNITVNSVNDAPVNSVPGTQTVAEDATLTFSAAGGNAITVSDVDAGGNAIQVTLTATNGTLAVGSTTGLTVIGNGTSTVQIVGSISAINAGLDGTTFVPNSNFNGPASITVTTNDLGNSGAGGPQTDTDTININVTAVNDAPVANNDSYSTNSGATLNVPAPGVLGNDTDVDSPTLTAILVSGPTHASSFALNADGSFSYTPASGFSGSDSFTYKANDGSADSNVATVSITVVAAAPVANQDNYLGVGNTELRVGLPAGVFPAAVVTGSVLDNDTDPDTPHAALVVSAFDATSANGGTVIMAPTGNFSYLPAVGFTGVDTFHYSVTDGTSTTVGVVQVTVNERVWYVNNSGINGTGRSNSPFNALANAQSASAANDYIYVHTGAGAYSGGIVLKNGQRLVGQGVALVVSIYTLNPAGGPPTIGTGASAGVTLANGNLVTGLNVAAGGFGITGSTVNSGTISQVNVNGGTDGISLTAAAGTFTISNVNVAPGGAGLVLSGGTATVNATNLVVTTTGGKGILGTGGALNISGTSSVASTGNGAVDLSGMALGITLNSASASGSTIGIRLNNTTGSFTSNGGTISNMTTAGLSASTATNVTVNNTTFTNAATTNGATAAICTNVATGTNSGCNAAIYLNNVTGSSFTSVLVDGSAQIGINGTNVTGFTLTNSEVRNAGNEAGESGLLFQNLNGTVTLTNANVHNSLAAQAFIENLSGALAMTVSGSTFANSVAPNGSHGLFVETRNTASATVSVSSSTFSGNFGNGLQVQGLNSASNNVTVTNNSFTSNSAGINLQVANGATLTYSITNNPLFSGSTLQAINVGRAALGTGAVTGTISGNTIGTSGVVGSACAGNCDGIDLRAFGSGSFAATVTGNGVHGVNSFGINAQASSGSSNLQVKISGNTLSAPNVATANNAIFVQSGAASSDTTSVCADIFSNTITGVWDANNTGTSIRVRNRFAGTTFRLPGYAGSPTSTAAVAAFLTAQNGGASASATISGNSFTGGASCITP
jgi:VCBS repeat-containing protein